MELEQAYAVRLDEGTDAGEFLYQNLTHVSDDRARRAAEHALERVDPTPESFAEALGSDAAVYDRVRQGLEHFGLEFESLQSRDDLGGSDFDLAVRGIESAERFVEAARVIGHLRRGDSR